MGKNVEQQNNSNLKKEKEIQIKQYNKAYKNILNS